MLSQRNVQIQRILRCFHEFSSGIFNLYKWEIVTQVGVRALLKIFTDTCTIAEAKLEKEIEFLQYASSMLMQLTNMSANCDVRQLKYLLAMASIEASDSLDADKKKLEGVQHKPEIKRARQA